MKKNKNKSLKRILVEVILLGVLSGLLVNLATGAIDDMFGVCGFTEKVCKDIELQGAIKGIASLICSIIAVVIGLSLSKLSKEFEESNGSNNQLDGKRKQLLFVHL